MTLKDIRAFAGTVAGWCHDQDDLLGYAIIAHEGGVRVDLEWPHRWSDAREFTVTEIRTICRKDLMAILGMMADDYRLQTAKLRDPNRLPG
jgi:hypothetical protein